MGLIGIVKIVLGGCFVEWRGREGLQFEVPFIGMQQP
jgi:hypothetical protein